MSTMTSAELRRAFLDFFASAGHEIVPSSPLVPGNDPTLLFTNAGMVQFKDVFLGAEHRDYKRAVTAQRCVRAGGKHNDLENVGYTARHHTFFEMLGNFSFGDYFKRDAIRYAWEFVTGVLGIPAERLWITVYEDDDEAADIWLKDIGIDAGRFSRLGEKDNFWAMGDTGPCGPCSEIFYDHGDAVAGGPPGSPDEDGDRYVEIWNLVFMQFERVANGEMTPLPKPSVDTGMGLERVAAVMQGVTSNYETDSFVSLIDAVTRVIGAPVSDTNSLQVIADHIRACAFLIVDGVLPGNEGRGYVLRRIIRRAIRHGYQLGVEEPFFYRLVQPLAGIMGEAYPELPAAVAHVERVLEKEEQRFAETISQGLRLLDDSIAVLDGTTIPGEIAFKLYDTYGFPIDLTADIARERGLDVDQAGFDAAMQSQRERARAASSFLVTSDAIFPIEWNKKNSQPVSEFSGYERDDDEARVTDIVVAGKSVKAIEAGADALVVLDRTPFYAESGGQVGDTGQIVSDTAEFLVSDTRKTGRAHAHIGRLARGRLAVGDAVEATVDAPRRDATRRNHTATHLLHAALRNVLGEHVSQKGSLVAPDRLRFDFSHYEALSAQELIAIEDLVNREILANTPAETAQMDFDAALAAGAIALFGEKYDSEVRVLKLGDFSMELCGGTHVSRTGDIGLFKITAEGGVAAGIRRIEAVTGAGALEWVRRTDSELTRIGQSIKGTRETSADKVEQLVARNRALEKEIAGLKQRLALGGGDGDADPAASAEEIGDLKVLTLRLDGTDAETLRSTIDRFKEKLGRGVVVVGSVDDGKVRLAAGVTRDATERIRAGDLIRDIAAHVDGRGGGRADFAQAGGTNPGAIDQALAAVKPWIRARFNNT